jgi:hypothetical protein
MIKQQNNSREEHRKRKEREGKKKEETVEEICPKPQTINHKYLPTNREDYPSKVLYILPTHKYYTS